MFDEAFYFRGEDALQDWAGKSSSRAARRFSLHCQKGGNQFRVDFRRRHLGSPTGGRIARMVFAELNGQSITAGK